MTVDMGGGHGYVYRPFGNGGRAKETALLIEIVNRFF